MTTPPVGDSNETELLSVDECGISRFFNHRDLLDSTVQIDTLVHSYIERMCVALAIYTELHKPWEGVKFDQPYLSEKAARSL